MAECKVLLPIWTKFLAMLDTPPLPEDRTTLILLGYSTPALPKALSDLHLILWKFILINFTLKDLQNRKFDSTAVWDGAIRRYASKANSLTYQVTQEVLVSEARGTAPRLQRLNDLLAPLSTISSTGEITWRADICAHISASDTGGGGPPNAP